MDEQPGTQAMGLILVRWEARRASARGRKLKSLLRGTREFKNQSIFGNDTAIKCAKCFYHQTLHFY